jgi:hypothetical protein
VVGETLGQPTARGPLENFFQILAVMSKNSPSATGNKPDSAARRSPEIAAVRWNVVAPLAEHLLDVKARNYNVTPSAQCFGISPIHRLHEMLAAGKVFQCPMGELRQARLYLFLPRYPATLSRKRGKKSFGPMGVNLFGGRYVGPELAADQELAEGIDMGVVVYVQPDARYGFVVPNAFPDRCYPVTLAGAFSDIPHTLETRRLVVAYAKNSHIKGHADSASLTTGVVRALGEAARTDNAAAVLLSGAVAFMDRFGRGDTTYVGMGPGEVESLADYARSIAKSEGDLDPGEDDDGLDYAAPPQPPQRPSPRSGASSVAPEPPPQQQSRSLDPYDLMRKP